jgi:hypothetical protein
MTRSRRWAALLAVLAAATIAGCSGGSDTAPDPPAPTVMTAEKLTCDRDQSSLEAKDTIERIGGLVTPDYTVRFSESTRLGIVAIVDRNAAEAYADLHDAYGVEIVARDDHDRTVGRTTDFQQVRDLVDAECG